MAKFLLKLPIKVNSKNGQLSSYFAKQRLPPEVKKCLDEQPGAVRHLLVEFKGFETG